jgi:pSer/pThr/pTyr-binding forkhead associated (FHA) protein
MPDFLFQVWKLVLLGFIYLFFLRVLWSIRTNLKTSTTPPKPIAPQQQPRKAQQERSDKTINRLKLLEPKEIAGRMYELGNEITIGRAPGCKVNLDDTYASQLHARVFRRDNQVLIEDLGSTNGTFCNGKKVSGPMPIGKGDRIQIGQTVLEAIK